MVVASEAAEADIARGTPIDQPLMLPRSLAPGLYNLLSVFAYGSGNQAGAISSAGIIRVVVAP